VVWNLLTNALKFTPAGGRVEAELRADGQQAVFQVRDTGRGIAAEALPHVFDMFRQGEVGTARRHGGLGIGLALVRNLVNAHGGRVKAESEGLDHGACFTVELPMGAAQAGPSANGEGAEPGRLRGLRALVVDDDQQALDTLRQLLQLEGVEVTACDGGAQALDAMRDPRKPFDFVVSDVAMPGMDGYELVRRLRELPGRASLPLIAISGLGRVSDAKRAIAAGFAAHLKKPVTLEKLLQTLRDVLPG
jgi:two-component system CheB/CheR fusion protein